MENAVKEPTCVWCGSPLEMNFSKYDDDDLGYFCGYICKECRCTTPSYIAKTAEEAQFKAKMVASLKTPYINPYTVTEINESNFERLCRIEENRIIPKDELINKSFEPVFLEVLNGEKSWEILTMRVGDINATFKGKIGEYSFTDYGKRWRLWEKYPSKRLARLASWNQPTTVYQLFPDRDNDAIFNFAEYWTEINNPHKIFKTKFCINRDDEIMILIDGFYWRLEDMVRGNGEMGWINGRDFRCWTTKPTEKRMEQILWSWKKD